MVEDINQVQPTFRLLGVVDDGDPDLLLLAKNGLEFLGGIDYLMDKRVGFAIAIGSGAARHSIARRLMASSSTPQSILHPTVRVGKSSHLGAGVVLCGGSSITSNGSLGDYVVVNLAASIGHDAVIHDCVTLMPGARVSGNVVIGRRTMIGANASIIQGKSIGDDVQVGAGAAVVTDLPSSCTAVGVPARVHSAY
jgi:sugar O-acyltransferase (sialic acid O-acetyltransferase NeuD family)